MLSFGKIVLLLAVVYVVFSFGRRFGARRAAPRPSASEGARPPAESLERCPKCGVFRAPGAAEDCGHADCPLRRKS